MECGLAITRRCWPGSTKASAVLLHAYNTELAKEILKSPRPLDPHVDAAGR